MELELKPFTGSLTNILNTELDTRKGRRRTNAIILRTEPVDILPSDYQRTSILYEPESKIAEQTYLSGVDNIQIKIQNLVNSIGAIDWGNFASLNAAKHALDEVLFDIQILYKDVFSKAEKNPKYYPRAKSLLGLWYGLYNIYPALSSLEVDFTRQAGWYGFNESKRNMLAKVKEIQEAFKLWEKKPQIPSISTLGDTANIFTMITEYGGIAIKVIFYSIAGIAVLKLIKAGIETYKALKK